MIADFDLPPELDATLRPVGVMRSPLAVHHDAPRQPRCGPTGHRGAIVIRQGLQNLLADLDGFSHVWAVFWCHHARGWNARVRPPRDRAKRGLFSTRAPHRPNPIGISALELLRIDKRVLHVGGHDLLDGTPILDLKPYVPYCDSVPAARAGWVDALAADQGPDHRPWWHERGLPPPRVYRERADAGDP